MFNQENTLCFPKSFDSPNINLYNTKNINMIGHYKVRTENPCVPGSIPGGTTKKIESCRNAALFFVV